MASTSEDIKIIPNTKFVVDGFTLKNKKEFKHFFLTHFHADHYNGIRKNWKLGTIYCTQTTCNLAKNKFGIDDKCFHVLELDRTYTICGVKVTFFDANHCPGSCCILFELRSGGTYFHTGDMRFDKDLFLTYQKLAPFFKPSALPPSHEANSLTERKRLDAIFLDTTYCDPVYNFPKQSEATLFISELVRSKMRTGKKILFMIGTYQIGKERIAQRISEDCNCKIFVTAEKFKALSCLDISYMDIFTMNPSQSDVHMVRMHELGWSKLFDLRKSFNNYDEIIAFRPSAWCWDEMNVPTVAELKTPTSSSLEDYFDVSNPPPKQEKRKPDKDGYTSVDVIFSKRANITVVSVPYSEHSSFSDLKDCVGLLNCKQIIPTVFRDDKHRHRLINYLSDAVPHTPVKLKLSVPADLLSGKGVGSATSKSSKFSKGKDVEPPANNKSITDFFSKAKKAVVNAVTSLVGAKQQQITTAVKIEKVVQKKKLVIKPKQRSTVKTEEDVVIVGDETTDGGKQNNPILVDEVDLTEIDLSEQKLLLLAFEREKQKSLQTTSTAPQLKRKNISDEVSVAKKRRMN